MKVSKVILALALIPSFAWATPDKLHDITGNTRLSFSKGVICNEHKDKSIRCFVDPGHIENRFNAINRKLDSLSSDTRAIKRKLDQLKRKIY